MTHEAESVTDLLERVSTGDRTAEHNLLELVYLELHRIAGSCMRNERKDHTLQPTALVNEAYSRICNQERTTWKNRIHFYNVAARVMRRILIDHARQRKALKRNGPDIDIPWMKNNGVNRSNPDLVISVDEALERLSKINPRQAQVVEMRFFAGLSEDEIAGVLDICTRTVKRDWLFARAWLHRELSAKA